MNIKKYLVLGLFLLIAAAASAQIKIPDTKISFKFPDDGWKFLETTNVDKNTTIHLFCYSGRYVIDNVGDTTLPYMRIYVRKNYDGSVYDLAYQRFLTQPFQSLDEYMYDDGSFGYLGAYTSEDDDKDYEFRMIYVKDRTTIVEIRLETTRDNYEEFDSDFTAILNSIKKQ